MKKFLLILLLAIYSNASIDAQHTKYLTGTIYDSITFKTMPGANIFVKNGVGTVSDENGKYSIKVKNGDSLVFSFIGYSAKTIIILDQKTDSTIQNIYLLPENKLMQEIVVSSSKYEKRLSDVNMSMLLLKPAEITKQNTFEIENIINTMPGVDILDGQPRIRGGSGYSYGVGTRVLVLVDDLPIISADAGDVKWDYIPIENLSQVEVVKGASSVLYGSSALNGIIHFRSAYPKSEPETRIRILSGTYFSPQRKDLKWWDTPPVIAGADFFHGRKIKNLDISAGGNVYKNSGYRENAYKNHGRFNYNLNYRFKKIAGLSAGVNGNMMVQDNMDFILWQDANVGALKQNKETISEIIGKRFNIDPYMKFSTKHGNKHSLINRYYATNNDFEENKNNNSQSRLWFSEYKYHHAFNCNLNVVSGISTTLSYINSNLYGDHHGSNYALFAQADKQIIGAKINYSAGIRYEWYNTDSVSDVSKPVLRTGITYQPFEYTFVRMSFGQGYRFPSIAEKFASTHAGSLKILPNPQLKPERGWTAETGVKQGIKLGSFKGYVDVACFISEYKNMIEYNFGLDDGVTLWTASFDDFGFQSDNVENARISGAELVVAGDGKLLNMNFTVNCGYTYTYPINLDITSDDLEKKTLKYRQYHSAKADIEIRKNKLAWGMNLILYSKIVNVDAIFTNRILGNIILPGYPSYRNDFNNGYTITNGRVQYNLNKAMQLSLNANNIFNIEYMGRPGDIRPPLNVTAQLLVRF